MLKNNKYLIYGGGLLAGVAIVSVIIPSEGGLCLDSRTMCVPLPDHMPDNHEHGPRPLRTINSAYAVGSSVSLVPDGLHLSRSWRTSS